MAMCAQSCGGNLVIFPKVSKNEDGRIDVKATVVRFDHPESLRTSGQRYKLMYPE